MSQYVYEDDELRSGPGIGGRYPRPFCTHCKGCGRLDYTITNHGERNEVVRDKCHYCNGEGREPATAVVDEHKGQS